MNENIIRQMKFWDKDARNFDAIYSHRKGRLGNFLDSLFRWDMYERYNYTMWNAEPIRNRTFLDIGCGTGRYSLEFARRGASKVIGLDISQKMINICNQRAQDEGLGDITSFIGSDLLGFCTQDKFDVCIGIGLFDYIKEPVSVISKMRESIQDRAIMSFPKFGTWRAPVRKARLSLKGCHVYFYTLKKLEKMLKMAGFKRYNLQEIGQLYCVTAFV
jgi:cyclopropane fatty-acyl-phospholipid synthase-like methyltransferase